jgi:hypothetical protein
MSFTCRKKYNHRNISASILGIFLKLNTKNYTFIAYLRRELGGDRPLTNGTLHGKHNNNTAISRLPFEAFS